MVDEGLTGVAASVHRAAEPVGHLMCGRRLGERCRLAVWGLVVAAFTVGCVTPVAAKAGTAAAAAVQAAQPGHADPGAVSVIRAAGRRE
ncbi:hypothetical protein Sme01_74160 [Sphaerisporangium melleum]|uniref:Uncharacterized protein n=1 Tax=Sphaerisporangium melleum TaxID=321316 RepID=A0A917RRB6_9ACTN|nr:hypothetical protein GCM10007964_73210 [Sphaerisporangium melleum]GII74940.1 hypothetical protein Sme01_74160 [Sphaerisporangium melleum]